MGELALAGETHEVSHRALAIRLTPIEFKLLYLLAANAGRVVTAARLVDYAWDDDGDVSLLKTHISHIRTKLGLPQDYILGDIRAVPRVGYLSSPGAP